VDLSGIIFVVLALAWAVFLIPKTLRRHDEAARTRSIDGFSSALRVLAHREPTEKNGSRLVVSPGRPVAAQRVTTATRVEVTEVTSVETPSPAAAGATAAAAAGGAAVPAAGPVAEVSTAATVSGAGAPASRTRTPAQVRARRAAARAAARRRRRILTFLLLCTVVTAVVAGLALVSWWSVAVPGGLTAVFLVLCRTQVRHESAADLQVAPAAPGAPVATAATADAAATEAPADAAPDSATWAAAPAETAADVAPVAEVSVDEHRVGDFEDEDTIGVPVAVLQAAAAQAENSSTLWDPLPVTLPTYVTKPRAQRTVRTIELGEPGTWTSGRTAEDARIAAQATDAEGGASGPAEGGRHAVGS